MTNARYFPQAVSIAFKKICLPKKDKNLEKYPNNTSIIY